MAATRRYGEVLRAIGQALEAKDISAFELKQTDDNYTVEGTPDQTSSKLGRWLRLRSGSRATSMALSMTEIERLSLAGQAKRTDSERLPNFRSVSNILRTIGAYLDAKEAKLLKLQKRRISITLSYRDRMGREQAEERTVSSFRQLFIELCGKRGHGAQTQGQA